MSAFEPYAEYDKRADAVYIYLSTAPVFRTRSLDDHRNLDLDAGGGMVGVEFLCVSGWIDLGGLPQRDQIAPLVESLQLVIIT